MKKILTVLLTCMLVISMTACNQVRTNSLSEDATNSSTQMPTPITDPIASVTPGAEGSATATPEITEIETGTPVVTAEPTSVFDETHIPNKLLSFEKVESVPENVQK